MAAKLRVVDLFSGCGGMSLGFENAGFSVVAAYDNWQPAVDVYSDNFNHPIFCKDLSDRQVINEIDKFKPEMIIGGPPCQDFSIAGKRKDKGDRANLTINYALIVAKVRPKWFVMENVYNIEKNPILSETIGVLNDAGYGISKTVLDASYLGVPQARKRFFLVGLQGAKDGFLDIQLTQNQSDLQLTVKEYLGDLIDTEFYYMHPRSYKRRAVFSVHEPSSTIRGVNRPIPANYSTHPADKSKITSEVRSLTTKERSYLQTFPKSFRFEGRKTNMEQLIGNAVPVKMAEYVAKTIAKYALEINDDI